MNLAYRGGCRGDDSGCADGRGKDDVKFTRVDDTGAA
jgi:hypothetical protein